MQSACGCMQWMTDLQTCERIGIDRGRKSIEMRNWRESASSMGIYPWGTCPWEPARGSLPVGACPWNLPVRSLPVEPARGTCPWNLPVEPVHEPACEPAGESAHDASMAICAGTMVYTPSIPTVRVSTMHSARTIQSGILTGIKPYKKLTPSYYRTQPYPATTYRTHTSPAST